MVAEPRPGKGNAVRAGFAAASGDIIVMLDGDGSMDPQEIGWLVTPLQHEYDFVKGSRYVTGGGSDDLTWLRSSGKQDAHRARQRRPSQRLLRPLLRLHRPPPRMR